MSRKLRNIKPRKVNRGVFEEQQKREENKLQNQRALLFILPLVMLAVLAVGVFFGYKFYLNSIHEKTPIATSQATIDDNKPSDPMILRIVSSASPIDESYVPETVECLNKQLSPEAAAALEKMISAAKEDGIELKLTEGYVSYKELQERYDKAVQEYRKKSDKSLVMAEAHVKKSFPPAGENELQTGLLVDLTADSDGYFGDSSAFTWLTRHCVDYGFILRYPDQENAGGLSYSPHLFRFVGKDYAYEMRSLDMNFEEFVQYAQAH